MVKNFFNDYFDENEQNNPDDEYEEDSEPNRKGNGKTFTKGFVTALSICMVAIGAALWTTVNNVNSYLNPEIATYRTSDTDLDNSSRTSSTVSYIVDEEAQVNATVSGVKNDKKSDKKDEAATEPVVFTAKPIKNKSVINDYSEIPVYNATLGDYRAHTGIDYEADVDDKIRTMGNGVVKDIYNDDMLGTVVVVEHSDSVESYYCGLAQTTLVQMGEVISAGDFVGTVYAIPGETAEPSHVHVAVKENGKWVNPNKFFKN